MNDPPVGDGTAYRFTWMGPEQVGAVKQFQAAHFDADAPQNRPGWLEWRLRNPHGCPILLCMDGDTIAGLSMFMPVRLRIAGQVRTAAFSTNTMVRPEYRRKGIGQGIHQARIRSYDVALSSGQSEENRALYDKLGFATLGGSYEIRVKRRLPRPYLKRRYLRALLAWAYWVGRPRRLGRDTRIVFTDTVPADLEPSVFDDRFQDHEVGPIHSPAYLRWRYADHPYFTYRFIRVYRGDARLAFAVIRPDGDQVWLSDVYCRPGDRTAVFAALGACLTSRRIVGRFIGETIRDAMSAAGWYTLKRRSSLRGATDRPDLVPIICSKKWCFFGGASDMEL